MIRNYLLVALRSMRRNKLYTFINISGLAIGMTATILILLFVKDELSYDRYHGKHDRIFRATRSWVNESGETQLHLGHIAYPYATLISNDFPEIIEETVRFQSGWTPLMIRGDRKFEEEHFFFVDDNVFRVFDWEFLQGDADALTTPNSVVLTESAAQKYFGDENALGQAIEYNNFGQKVPLKVTGIIRDVPSNSHFHFEMLGSLQTVIEAMENLYGIDMMQNYGGNNYATYLLFREGVNPEEFVKQEPAFIDRHQGEGYQGMKMSDITSLHLQPLSSIHLYSSLDSEIEPNGDIRIVYIYITVAILTLVIACINFMNLATAKSSVRSKEVGLRKVMGAVRPALIRQFLVESVVYALFGLLLAYLLVNLLLPSFNQLLNKQIVFDLMDQSQDFLILIGVVIFVGVLAGSYPAFFLSSFSPSSIIRKTFEKPSSRFNLRSILVVVQFSIAIMLIVGVGIIRDQVNFMRNKPVGFNHENVLTLPMNQVMYDDFENLKSRLEKQEGIEMVSMGSRVPPGRLLDSQGMTAEINGEMKELSFRVADVHVDHAYLDLLEVPIIAGRNFDPEIASDSTESFVINKSTVYQIGWDSPGDAIGKNVKYGDMTGKIIGVTDDIHFESLHQSVVPIIFIVTRDRFSSVMVRYTPRLREETEQYLNEQWTYMRPDYPFTYQEVSEEFQAQYDNESRLARVITAFSWLAVIIAALGLYGLASFIAEKRQKEIGIRKVLGASVSTIVILLSKNFTILVLVSFIVASPIIYFAATQWLDQFPYHEQIQLSPFITAGVFALITAWITIIYQTLRAATTNPVDAIRDE